MHRYTGWGVSLLALIAQVACATAAPPKSYLVRLHPSLDKREGLVLVVDVCIVRKEVGREYFPLEEAVAVAKVLGEKSRAYLESNGAKVDRVIVPFVCGGLREAGNPPRSVAPRIGGTLREARPPFAIETETNVDPDLAEALSMLATKGFQKAFEQQGKLVVRGTVGNGPPKATPSSVLPPAPHPTSETDSQSRDGASVVMRRLHASSVLYIGARGVSRSRGLATAEFVPRALFTELVYIGSIILTPVWVLIWIPGGSVDFGVTAGALFGLESGAVEWANGVVSGKDPLEPDAIGSPAMIDELLETLVFHPAPAADRSTCGHDKRGCAGS